MQVPSLIESGSKEEHNKIRISHCSHTQVIILFYSSFYLFLQINIFCCFQTFWLTDSVYLERLQTLNDKHIFLTLLSHLATLQMFIMHASVYRFRKHRDNVYICPLITWSSRGGVDWQRQGGEGGSCWQLSCLPSKHSSTTIKLSWHFEAQGRWTSLLWDGAPITSRASVKDTIEVFILYTLQEWAYLLFRWVWTHDCDKCAHYSLTTGDLADGNFLWICVCTRVDTKRALRHLLRMFTQPRGEVLVCVQTFIYILCLVSIAPSGGVYPYL